MKDFRKYSRMAEKALAKGVKQKEFLAELDVPPSIRKVARLAFQVAERMCPRCHGRLKVKRDKDGYEEFVCAEGIHIQWAGETISPFLTSFPRRKHV